MYSSKIILAAAALTVAGLAGAGTANAAPMDYRDHRPPPVVRHEMHPVHRPAVHRAYVARTRVYDILRTHHYRGIGDPYFVRGHYVVRVVNARGRTVFVQIDPYTGAFIGEIRL